MPSSEISHSQKLAQANLLKFLLAKIIQLKTKKIRVFEKVLQVNHRVKGISFLSSMKLYVKVQLSEEKKKRIRKINKQRVKFIMTANLANFRKNSPS